VAKLVLGCSGWDYDEWVGSFYKSPGGSKLKAYTPVFNTVEINSTFYRYPSPGMVKGWLTHTPEDFVFTAKVPQVITHEKWLDLSKGVRKDMDRFLDVMRPLNDAGKLKCLLIQLRPKMTFEHYRLVQFFEELDTNFRYALEFRNKSWLIPEAFELLEEYKIANCIVDEPLLPPDIRVTTDFAYIRWHGHGKQLWYDYRYSKEELRPWVPKIEGILKQDVDVWGYFNNHFHGNAPENCLEILEMLGKLSEKQKEYMEKKSKPTRISTLDDFF
jgi:uncharacterized protein YecE (DUF72 family)